MPAISVVHYWTADESDWDRLRGLGDVTYHDGYPASYSELIDRVGTAQIVVGADVSFPAEVIDACPDLEMISVWSTGYDNVDLEAVRRRGVTMCNVPGYSRYSVSEHAWAMVLHLARKLGKADAYVRGHGFDWSAIQGMELHGKTVGIIGTGAIGANSAVIARGFGCQVLAYTLHPDEDRALRLGVTYVSLPELLARSHIILPHLPWTPASENLFDAEAFAQMEQRPILVNTARGGIIEPHALVDALEQGTIGGAGLETLWQEPPDWESPLVQKLMGFDNVVFSPHCAAITPESMARLTAICIDNIEAYLAGKPTNMIV